MNIYTVNEEGRRQILDYLRAQLTGAALGLLETPEAQSSWFSDAEVNATEDGGGFEIPARMNRTRNPIPVIFGPECFDVESIED
jgi:hypothetical protein